MSQENVEIVRAAAEAYNRGDLDAFLDYLTDDIDHRAVEGALDDRGPMHGKDAVRAYLQDWLDTFDELKVCVAYDCDGIRYTHLPYHQSVLHKVTPVYEELPGWRSDLSKATEPADMPREAKDFVSLIAEQAGVPIRLVGVGPSRDQFVHFAA